jgi:alpha-galactosidase
MRDAIVGAQNTSKLHFNLCNWGRDEVWTWGNDYGHSWRWVITEGPRLRTKA